jgi:hypothetical protein
MESAERSISIYALTDPSSGDVHYVGQAVDLWKRYARHLFMLGGRVEKQAWLKDLKAKGTLPGLKILEVVSPDEADCRERWWISEYRRQGWCICESCPRTWMF